MNTEKLDLLHRISMVFGPKIDQELLKNLLILLTLLSDRETGDELKKLIK